MREIKEFVGKKMVENNCISGIPIIIRVSLNPILKRQSLLLV